MKNSRLNVSFKIWITSDYAQAVMPSFKPIAEIVFEVNRKQGLFYIYKAALPLFVLI